MPAAPTATISGRRRSAPGCTRRAAGAFCQSIRPARSVRRIRTGERIQVTCVRYRTVTKAACVYAGRSSRSTQRDQPPLQTGARHDPEESTPSAEAHAGASPDADTAKATDTAGRALRGAGPAQEHRSKGSQGRSMSHPRDMNLPRAPSMSVRTIATNRRRHPSGALMFAALTRSALQVLRRFVKNQPGHRRAPADEDTAMHSPCL